MIEWSKYASGPRWLNRVIPDGGEPREFTVARVEEQQLREGSDRRSRVVVHVLEDERPVVLNAGV